jgi:hypothetical protein
MSREDARLIVRAKQILADENLLRQLAANVKGSPEHLESMLAEISDPVIRAQMRAAIAEINS